MKPFEKHPHLQVFRGYPYSFHSGVSVAGRFNGLVFRGIKFEPDTEIEQNRVFFRGLELSVDKIRRLQDDFGVRRNGFGYPDIPPDHGTCTDNCISTKDGSA